MYIYDLVVRPTWIAFELSSVYCCCGGGDDNDGV
jgi:hypothetical protein